MYFFKKIEMHKDIKNITYYKNMKHNKIRPTMVIEENTDSITWLMSVSIIVIIIVVILLICLL